MNESAPPNQQRAFSLSLSTFLATSWALLTLVVFAYTDLSLPNLVETSDYLMAFYVAGHLVSTGNLAALYPGAEARSFVDSPFNQAAHTVLTHLPEASTAAYMYMPLIACIFAPLSLLSPTLSLILWQLLSTASLFVSTCALRLKSKERWIDTIAAALCFAPVSITIWIGQLGLVFGLLPFAAGYLLLLRQKPFAAGLSWSLIFLKPQLFPAVATIAFCLALNRRARCLGGLLSGTALLVLLNILCCSPDIFVTWLQSLSASERILADPAAAGVSIPSALILSLPHSLLLILPKAQQIWLKPAVYALSTAIGAVGLWYCTRLSRATGVFESRLALIASIAISMLPLIMPHFLIYDLCLFVALALLLSSYAASQAEAASIRALIQFGFWSINVYTLILIVDKRWVHPLLLIGVVLGIFGLLLKIASDLVGKSKVGSSSP